MNPVVEVLKTIMHQGLERLGRYYSTYPAFVTNREDPLFYGRLQLSIPNIHGVNKSEYWAYPKNCYAGNGYGMQIIPQVGDMVWVEFLLGDPRRPVWSFGHFAKDAQTLQPEKPSELSGYDNYWFKTPQGHLIELDDSVKEVRITAIGGSKVFITDFGVNIIRADKRISLGKLNGSDEPAVLGNKNEDTFNKILGYLNDLQIALLAQTSADATTATDLGMPGVAALGAALGTIQTQLTDIQTSIPLTKSQQVTLD